MFFAPFIKDATDYYEIILGVALLGACLFFWHGSRLRKVILDRETLIISNYSREVRSECSADLDITGKRKPLGKDEGRHHHL